MRLHPTIPGDAQGDTATRDVIASIPPHVMGEQPDVLLSITDPRVNLSLWQRPQDPDIVNEVQALRATQLRDVRRSTSLQSFDDDFRVLLQKQGVDPRDFTFLHADLHRLVSLFAKIAPGPEFRFRLFTTDRDDCRRFHLDRTSLRLMCTYRGPGTEWLTDAQVDRVALTKSAPNESIIRFGEPSHFEPFWVGILRGDSKNAGQGLVHRSPPVSGSGEIRLLFCLDG